MLLILMLLEMKVDLVVGRVFCQDSHAMAWMSRGFTCPVMCESVRNAIERQRPATDLLLIMLDYKNVVQEQLGGQDRITMVGGDEFYENYLKDDLRKPIHNSVKKDKNTLNIDEFKKYKNTLNIDEFKKDTDNLNIDIFKKDKNTLSFDEFKKDKNTLTFDQFKKDTDTLNIDEFEKDKNIIDFDIIKEDKNTLQLNEIKKDETTLSFDTTDKKDLAYFNPFLSIVIKGLRNTDMGIFRRSSLGTSGYEKETGKCWGLEKFEAKLLLGKVIRTRCTRKSNFDVNFLSLMTNIINKYVDTKFEFTEEMTEILLEHIFGKNTDLRNSIFDVNKLLKFLRNSLDLHKSHTKNEIILKSRHCLSISLPGCFCRPGYVENDGQCVSPSDCITSEYYTQYLSRIIVL